MRGFLIHFSLLCMALLSAVPVFPQERQMADTLAASVVTAEEGAVSTHTGLVRLNPVTLTRIPSLLGTPDVIKSLQNLPGVASGMELMSGLYVHGGDGSDNLFLLDGVPLYQVCHLAGLFSPFNTDIVKSIDFYRSGFPAHYGGRLSSVVDIVTDDGGNDGLHGSFSIGLIDGRLRLGGPVVKDRLLFNAAVRRSWLDAILAPAMAIANSGKGGYSLMDANVSLTYLASSRDRMDFRFYGGSDRLNYSMFKSEKFYGKEIYTGESGGSLKMKWGNFAASSSWRHDFTEKSFLELMAFYSRGYSDIANSEKTLDFSDEVLTSSRAGEDIRSSVNASGFKFTYVIGLNRNKIRAGADYQHGWYDPLREQYSAEGDNAPVTVSDSRFLRSDELSVYAEDSMTYGPFNVNAGLRLDTYMSGRNIYFRPQPRLSASCSFGSFLTMKASYTSMTQFAHLLSSVFLDLPTNLWMPSTEKVKPSDSHQVSLGIYSGFLPKWHIDIEGYYKTTGNCLIYSGSTSLFPPIEAWEDSFVAGKGRSYGAELEVGYNSEKLQASLYYTLSWSERLFQDLYPDWFFDRYDNRHKLTLTGSYRINKKIELNASWNYHSGNRVTMPERVVDYYAGGHTMLFSGPYNQKMPDYHRLDLGCSFHRTTRRGNESIWNISIYNVYCRMNPIIMTFAHLDDGQVAAKVYSMVPVVPSFSYTLKF